MEITTIVYGLNSRRYVASGQDDDLLQASDQLAPSRVHLLTSKRKNVTKCRREFMLSHLLTVEFSMNGQTSREP